jgi:GntR family transcriptional regulator, rspAB operon transcriptional repressor
LFQARDMEETNTEMGKTRKRKKDGSAIDKVLVTLRQDILTGRIGAGELLSEISLSERFKVSRTPVRKALAVLASEGLITTLPKRGHLVRTVSLSEVKEAFFLREILEVEAVALACRRIKDSELDQLGSMYKNATPDQMAELNHKFHSTIAHASGNRILAEFIDQLLLLMQRIILLDPELTKFPPEGVEESVSAWEEFDILKALRARDEVAAREAMRRHIRRTEQMIWQRPGE